jgi:peptidoglycan hydrolase-like protein with peptidoglycan-binding domain
VFLLAPLLVGSHLLAVADSVPVFDVKKSCQGRDVAAVFAGRNSDTVCIQSEQEARDQLRKIWGEFSAKDKAGCTLTATTGCIPSYIELLTCLEIIRDVDKLRATSSDRPASRQSTQQEQMLAQQQNQTARTGAGRDHIREVQRDLLRKGYDPGPVDGIFGPKTEGALREFQKAQQLPVTGQLDDRSLAALKAGQTEVGGEKSTGPKETPTPTSPSTPRETSAPTSPTTPPGPQETSTAISPSTPPETSAPTSPSTPQETSAQRSPDNQPNTLSQKPNAPEEPIAGEDAKRSWWRSLWDRLWGR